MDQVTKLTVAMELIEDRIANCMRKMEIDDNKEVENEYKELQEIRNRIYKRDFEVIEKLINDARRKDND